MDNLACKPEEQEKHAQIIRFIDIDKDRPGNWQYVDVDEFEFQIRQDEAAKWVALREKERQRRRRRNEALISMVLATSLVRVVSMIIFLICIIIASKTDNAMPVIAFTPFCILGTICPGYNSEDSLIEKYERHNKD